MTRNEILSIRSLHNRPERRRTNRFIVEGVKGLIELSESNMAVLRIYSLDSMLEHVQASMLEHVGRPKPWGEHPPVGLFRYG